MEKAKKIVVKPVLDDVGRLPSGLATERDNNSKELRETLLGKVFVEMHCYGAPSVVQVTGWSTQSEKPAAKRRYIFVRPIKFNGQHYQGGGEGRIDQESVLVYNDPVRTNDHNEKLLFRELNDGTIALSKGTDWYFVQNDLTQLFTWCEY